jgi:hypothetical protein
MPQFRPGRLVDEFALDPHPQADAGIGVGGLQPQCPLDAGVEPPIAEGARSKRFPPVDTPEIMHDG